MTKEKESSSGSGFGVLGVIASYAMARFAPGPAVRRLVSTLGSRNEDTSTAAYMALVKLGPRVSHRLLDAVREDRQAVSVLRVLGDQGDRAVIPELEEFARSPDSAVAGAARESLEVLLGDDTETTEMIHGD